MATQTTPAGYHTVTPYLIVDNAAKALEFYQKALNAKEIYRLPTPGDKSGKKIAHAEIRIGDSQLMLSDEYPDMDALGPKSLGGTPASFLIYVDDVDKAFEQAVNAGGKAVQPVEDQFWGDRMGTLTDPFGHQWSLATHVEDVPEAEMQARMEQFGTKQKEAEPA